MVNDESSGSLTPMSLRCLRNVQHVIYRIACVLVLKVLMLIILYNIEIAKTSYAKFKNSDSNVNKAL
jgi:hypothetical protein